MNLFSILRFIIRHSLNQHNKWGAVAQFIKWHLYSFLFPYPIIFPFTERSKLIMEKGMSGATGNLYCGLHEYQDMGFLLHFLRDTDIFADVGANVGSYTLLASAHIGAQTISIEPVPDTFISLKQNIAINHVEDKVAALNIGVGAVKGKLRFTRAFGTKNHVAQQEEQNTIDVPVDNLDNILAGRTPVLIKIDVEGYEEEVMKGASGLFTNPALKAVIIEICINNPYGFDEDILQAQLVEFGFTRYRYDPVKRVFFKGENGEANSLYLRDMDFVAERIRSAEKVKINRMTI